MLAISTGVEYYLNTLPAGFALFEIAQPHGTQTYKRIFGHWSGKYYDSIPRFQPHFLWLMSGMEGDCECMFCSRVKRDGQVVKRRVRGFAERQPLVTNASERKTLISSVERESSTRSDPVAGRNFSIVSARPQRQIRSAGAPYALDSEGTEDVYKDQLKRLEANKDSTKGIEDDVREPNSIDWRAEHSWTTPDVHDWAGTDLVQQTLTSIEHQHAFVPRVGELVLFCPNFLDQHYLMLDEATQEYKFYSFQQKCYHGFPSWRAGVIAEIPSATGADGPVDFPDIQDLPQKHNSLNTGGFRVETFPDPNNAADKTASKQCRYLTLRNIRPFSHWHMLLRGIPRTKWHASIEHALTCMTSISLLEKFYFKGDWDLGKSFGYASLRCKGIFIGAELITLGDTVRIASQRKGKKRCTDALVVESIRLHLIGVKSEHVQPNSPLLSSDTSITLVGKAYTLDKSRHYRLQGTHRDTSQNIDLEAVPPEDVKTVFRPVGSAMYGEWYPLHAAKQRYEISYDQILGRMYEAAAVQLWTGMLQRKPTGGHSREVSPTLDYDSKGIEEGRLYSTQSDERLDAAPESSIRWFWADTRAEALDLQTLNGVEVGKYDKVRDRSTLELWRTHLKILNGQQILADSIASKYTNFANFDLEASGGKRGRPAGSKMVNGKLYKPGDPGFNQVVSGGDTLSAVQLTPSKHKGSQMAGAALVSTDEDEDEDDADEDDLFEDAKEEWGLAMDGPSDGPMVSHGSPSPMQKKPKKEVPEVLAPKMKVPKSKAEIMENAELSDDDDDWYNYLPPARGGTEETEGGDYDPRAGED